MWGYCFVVCCVVWDKHSSLVGLSILEVKQKNLWYLSWSWRKVDLSRQSRCNTGNSVNGSITESLDLTPSNLSGLITDWVHSVIQTTWPTTSPSLKTHSQCTNVVLMWMGWVQYANSTFKYTSFVDKKRIHFCFSILQLNWGSTR